MAQKKATAPKKTTAKKAPVTKTAKPAAAQKNNNTKTVVIVVSVVIFFFVVLPIIVFGIGAAILGNKLAENGVSVDSGKSISINDGNGNSFSAGGSQSLPEGFPSAVKLYNGQITSSGRVNVSGETGWTVTVTTNDGLSQVMNSIASTYSQNGWTTELNTTSENGALFTATNGNLRVSVFGSNKDGQTSVLYTVNTQSDNSIQ